MFDGLWKYGPTYPGVQSDTARFNLTAWGGQRSKTVMVLALALPLTLAGCSSDGSRAEDRYEIVERNGTRGDLCRAAKDVADAYLRSGNEKEYQKWLITSSSNCTLFEWEVDFPANEQAAAPYYAALENAADAAEKAADEIDNARE